MRASRIRVVRRGAPLGSASSRANTRRRGAAVNARHRSEPGASISSQDILLVAAPWKGPFGNYCANTCTRGCERDNRLSGGEHFHIRPVLLLFSGLILSLMRKSAPSGATNGRTDGRTDGRVNECTNGRSNLRAERRRRKNRGAESALSRVNGLASLCSRNLALEKFQPECSTPGRLAGNYPDGIRLVILPTTAPACRYVRSTVNERRHFRRLASRAEPSGAEISRRVTSRGLRFNECDAHSRSATENTWLAVRFRPLCLTASRRRCAFSSASFEHPRIFRFVYSSAQSGFQSERYQANPRNRATAINYVFTTMRNFHRSPSWQNSDDAAATNLSIGCADRDLLLGLDRIRRMPRRILFQG